MILVSRILAVGEAWRFRLKPRDPAIPAVVPVLRKRRRE